MATHGSEVGNSHVGEKGHPPGLTMLFFTEMWERFSYYGMRALLVLYMTRELLWSDNKSYGIYGSYTALVYATPVIGGLLADRLLGYRKAVTVGGLLMAVGQFALATESPSFFYVGLAFLIVGNGFFKPNISTIVGRLYAPGDHRRDRGFTIFYMGINLGALFAPLVCGYIGETYGWKYGFGLAGLGMLLGLVQFQFGQHKLHGVADPPDPARLRAPVVAMISREWAIYLGSLVVVVLAMFLVQWGRVVGYALGLTGILVVAYILYFMISQCSREERGRMWVALVLTFFSIVFWAFFEQAGSSINLFTERNVDRSLFGWDIPTSMFQSVNPAFIILLAPLFAGLWGWLDRRDLEPNIPVKFGLGIVQLGLGFGAFWIGAQSAGGDGMVALVWLVLGYLLHTTGELCLSPVGLSMITKLSVARVAGMMMGTWFLATASAQYVGGLIAQLTGVEGGAVEGVVNATESIGVYGSVFGQIAIFALVTGVFVLAVAPFLKRGMHGVK